MNEKEKSIRYDIKKNMTLFSLVLIGAVNLGMTAVGYNLIEILSTYIGNLFGTTFAFYKIVYILIAISAILLATDRDTWLPFLGINVLPSNLVPVNVPTSADKTMEITTTPNTKIAYWSAYNVGDNVNVYDAYGDYKNSGVVMSDEKGKANLIFKKGSGYTVPSGDKIPKHVHYRTIGDPKGMMGKIETIYY